MFSFFAAEWVLMKSRDVPSSCDESGQEHGVSLLSKSVSSVARHLITSINCSIIQNTIASFSRQHLCRIKCTSKEAMTQVFSYLEENYSPGKSWNICLNNKGPSGSGWWRKNWKKKSCFMVMKDGCASGMNVWEEAVAGF